MYAYSGGLSAEGAVEGGVCCMLGCGRGREWMVCAVEDWGEVKSVARMYAMVEWRV